MIKKLDTSEKGILEYEVSDKLSEEENKEVLREIEKEIETHGNVRLLVRMVDVPTIELSAIDDRLKFAKEHLGNIEKYAIVSDANLTEYLASFGDTITTMNVHHFSKDEEVMARSWVRD